MSQRLQPLKWHGGKYYLANRIIELFPEHVHYVEPFFGGGAVLFAKPNKLVENHSEVINDLNGDLMAFWQVLRDTELFDDFKRVIDATPLSKPVWESTFQTDVSPVRRAVDFFIRYRQSRQGLGSDFATLSRSRTRRGMNEQVSSWLTAVADLPDAHLRLRRVVIYSEDAVAVIVREDSKDTFFYCDPPYYHATRSVTDAYTHEMSNDDHARLLETLGELSGRFILSGYSCDLYNSAADRFGWRRVDIEIDNKSSGAKVKPIKTECLWLNY